MASPWKKPKLTDSPSTRSSAPTSSDLDPPAPAKVQSKISSFFQKAPSGVHPNQSSTANTPASLPISSSSTAATASANATSSAQPLQGATTPTSVLDGIDLADEAIFDVSAFSSQAVRPAPAIPKVPAKPPMEANLRGVDLANKRVQAKVTQSKAVRAAGMDAEEQRQVDKQEKQREKNLQKYSFLKNPLDAQRRPPSDPEYDPRSLHIPMTIYHNMTDFERQYWDIKSKYFNYVVFFQKGIFYELMELDADVGAKELGLVPAYRAGMRSTGFSINDGPRHAELLVQRGYSVVFVTQTESPVDRARSTSSNPSSENAPTAKITTFSANKTTGRTQPVATMTVDSDSDDDGSAAASTSNSNPKKRKAATPEPEKMLTRIVDRIMTPGTTPDTAFESARPLYLLALHVVVTASSHTGPKGASIGLCLVNMSTNSFVVGQLEENDLESFTQFRTLLFHTRPREVLFEKTNLPRALLQLLKLHCDPNVSLRPRLAASCPATDSVQVSLNTFVHGNAEQAAIAEIRGNPLAMLAVGIALNFLEETNNFAALLQASWETLDGFRRITTQESMVLDSKALENLHLLEDEEHNVKNSIFGLVDRTNTKFGRRLLFTWVCYPLQCPIQVETRLRCVDFLIDQVEIANDLGTALLKLKCDLERSLAKAASNRLTLKDTIGLIDALALVSRTYRTKWLIWTQSKDLKLPSLLRKLLLSFDGAQSGSSGGKSTMSAIAYRAIVYSDVAMEETAHKEVAWLSQSFDRDAFNSDSKLVPSRGVSQDYDVACDRLEVVNTKLQQCVDEVVRWYRRGGQPSSSASSHAEPNDALRKSSGGSTVYAKEVDSIGLNDVGKYFRLIEVPSSLVKLYGIAPTLIEVPKKHTSATMRFYTAAIEGVLLPEWRESTLDVEREAEAALSKLHRRIASCLQLWWSPWVHALGTIDCLLSLAQASQLDPQHQCRPQLFALQGGAHFDAEDSPPDTHLEDHTPFVLPICHKPFLLLEGSVHPLLATGTGRSFLSTVSASGKVVDKASSQVIANDILLGTLPPMLVDDNSDMDVQEDASVAVGVDKSRRNGLLKRRNGATTILLTGPNMGGKSTLLRQSCLAVIMAQLGVYPFATRCVLTTVDRVFTRIGASDHIFEGRSTFMVEMEEAGNVLKHGTERSLVVLDELGRGTSTFDGYSIAYATLRHLAISLKSLTLFSTHYHMLTDELEADEAMRNLIAPFYMDALVRPDLHAVTFLYKMVPGICPQSYGMLVAAMAQLPLNLVRNAHSKSVAFHVAMQAKQITSPQLKERFLALASLLHELTSRVIFQTGD